MASLNFSKSDGGRKLALLTHGRQFTMLGGNARGNMLPNPTFATLTGGTIATATGNVPSGWKVFATSTGAVVFGIKRAKPRRWNAGMVAALGDVVFGKTRNTPWAYVSTVAGYAAGAEPTWPVAMGGTVVDSGITWRAIDPTWCDGKAGSWLAVYVPTPTPLPITAVSQAAPGVVTCSASTLMANNVRCLIDGIAAGSMVNLNGHLWSMLSVNTGAGTFNLGRDDTNANASTTGFPAYVGASGGVVLPFTSVTINLPAGIAKSTNWSTGDRLRLAAEVLYPDIDIMRGASCQITWPEGTSSGESLGSALSSQGIVFDGETLTDDFMAPSEMSAAAQTLNPTFNFSFLSGHLLLAAPRLSNVLHADGTTGW